MFKTITITAAITLGLAVIDGTATAGGLGDAAAKTAGFLAIGDSECAVDVSDKTQRSIETMMSTHPMPYIEGAREANATIEKAGHDEFCFAFALFVTEGGY